MTANALSGVPGTVSGVPVEAGQHVHADDCAHAGRYVYAYPPVRPQQPPMDPFSRFVVRTWERAPVWIAPLAVLVCFAGGVAYTVLKDPTESGAFANPTCLIKLTTGFDCPGCGGTRAFWYLLHGNVPAAARSHLLAVFAAPFLVYMYLAWTANLLFKAKLPMLRLSPRSISIFLAVWGVFAVARNLPWAPFDWLYV